MTRRWPRQDLHAVRGNLPLEATARQLGYRQDPRDSDGSEPDPSSPSTRLAPSIIEQEPAEEVPSISSSTRETAPLPRPLPPSCRSRRFKCQTQANNTGQPSANASTQPAASGTGSSTYASDAASSTPTATRTPSSDAPTERAVPPAPNSSAHEPVQTERPSRPWHEDPERYRAPTGSPPQTSFPVPSSWQTAPSTRSPHSRSTELRKEQPSSHPPQAQRQTLRTGSKHGNQAEHSAHPTQTPPAIRTPRPSPNAIHGSNDADPKARAAGTKSLAKHREHLNSRNNHRTIRRVRHPRS